MKPDLIFNPELRLRDGTVIRDRQDALAFARRFQPQPALGVDKHILHVLENAITPEEVEAAAQRFRGWLKRLDLVDPDHS
jgi:hypothetical protein